MIVITERHLIEVGRVIVEIAGNRFMRDPAELVVLDGVPDIEKEHAAWLQDATRLAGRQLFIGHEHDPKLAHHRVKHPIAKWQAACIGLLPFDGFALGELGRRMLKHRLVQICRD